MPRIILYEDQIQRQGSSRVRLRPVDYGPSGLAEGLETTGKAADGLNEDLQRAKDIEAAREVWFQDLTGNEFWKGEQDRVLGTTGYAAEAAFAETKQRAALVREGLLKRVSTPEGKTVLASHFDERSTGVLEKLNAHVALERRKDDETLHRRQLSQVVQDFCEAPDPQRFDHIARGNDLIADHAAFNGLDEAWQLAARQAFVGSAVEACIRDRLDKDDPAAAKSMLDWGEKAIAPKTAAELRGSVDIRVSELQAERDAGEIVAALPASGDGSFDLAAGLARIEAQDWPEPRKAQAARELRFRNGEARRQREARYDEAGQALGALFDERKAAGTPVTSLKQIPIPLRLTLRPEVLQDLDDSFEAQDLGERPQPGSALVVELTYLAATDPDAFRRRLVHPDLLRGRVPEAEAKNLWQMKQATEPGAGAGVRPETILHLLHGQDGPAATPEEQAKAGQIVFRVFQRVRREHPDGSPTQDQLLTLVRSEREDVLQKSGIGTAQGGEAVIHGRRGEHKTPEQWEAEQDAYERKAKAEEDAAAAGSDQVPANGRWDGVYDGIRFADDPDLQRSAFLLGAYDGATSFETRLGVTEEQLGHLPPENGNSLAGQLIAENPSDSRRLIFILAKLKQGAAEHPQFAAFLAPQIAAIEAEIARRMPGIEAADRMAGRAQLDVVKSAIPPLDTLTAAYRLGVNGEVNAEHLFTLGTAGLPIVGKGAATAAGKIVGKSADLADEAADAAGGAAKGLEGPSDDTADAVLDSASSAPASRQTRLKVRLPAPIVKAMGPAPLNMERPHRHHILSVNGKPGAERELVREGQDILRAHGIDPFTGLENLTWAPNKGHKIKETRAIVYALRQAHESGSKKRVLRTLDAYAKRARDR